MSEEIKSVAKEKEFNPAITEDNVKATVKEFLAKNPKLEWSQKTAAFCLAKVIVDAAVPAEDFKAMAKFLAQESLHGLCGNASQFKQWYFGKSESKKAALNIDELAE